MTDTIFALATLMGKSGVSVIRISGEHALSVLHALGFKKTPIPNHVYFSKLFTPDTSDLLDEGIVLYFKAPHSFTGEDIIELQLHGSIAVISDTINALSQLPYLRPAEAGEFAKRAFMNNKLDLTKAEGLSLLIDAETSIQRKLAINQLQGNLETLYEGWRKELISILAKIEAYIDFPDDDIPTSAITEATEAINNLIGKIEKHVSDDKRGEILFKGIHVAIIGAPNVGKSSLLNLIAKRDVAIVSNIAGTTRDVIEVKVNLEGYPVTFFDTAGIRETEDVIESEGVKRSLSTLESADIVIFVCDDISNLDATNLLNNLQAPESTILLLNKVDILDYNSRKHFSAFNLPPNHILEISVKTEYGMENFFDILLKNIKDKYNPSSEPVITKARYRKALQECVTYLKQFSNIKTLELAAEDLRLAAYFIGTITGRVDIEEVLDEIFSNFCIGK